MTRATEREDKGDFCIYSAVDEIKSSPAVGRRETVHYNLRHQVRPLTTADNLVEICEDKNVIAEAPPTTEGKDQ